MKLTKEQLEALIKAGLVDLDRDDKEFAEKEAEREKRTKKRVPKFNPFDFDQDIPDKVPPEWYIDLNGEPQEEHIKPRIVSQSGKGLCDIPKDCPAKVLEYGNTVEIITSSSNSTGEALLKYRKLSADEYINTETGEIKQYKKNENRLQPMAIAQFNKSVRKLKRLIIGNFSNNDGLFITLAYDYYMTNYADAQKDYNSFYDKLKYYCKAHLGITKLLYIKVVEAKASGSWHFHILLKSQDGTPIEISEDWLRKKWKQNSVSAKSITNVKGLALYLSRSTNASNDVDCQYDGNEEDGISVLADKYDKERRKYYTSGMHLFSASQELLRPDKKTMSQKEAREKVEGYKLTDKRYSIVKYRSRQEGYRILRTTNYVTYEKND